MTEPLVDLKALLVEREEFEGSMVSKLREGLSQGANQIRALKDINDILQKRLAAAPPAQQKKLHLKLGVVHHYLGHMALAVEHLKQSEGPLASFFLGRTHVHRGEFDEALKAFEKAEKSGYTSKTSPKPCRRRRGSPCDARPVPPCERRRAPARRR